MPGTETIDSVPFSQAGSDFSIWAIRCSAFAPPGEKSSGCKGSGTLVLQGDTMQLSLRVQNFPLLMVLVPLTLLPILCGIFFALFQANMGGPAGRGIFLAVVFGWIAFLNALTKSSRVFVLNTKKGLAWWVQSKKCFCLQLHNDRWIAIRAERDMTKNPKDHPASESNDPPVLPEFDKAIRERYGDRLIEDVQQFRQRLATGSAEPPQGWSE